MPTERGIAVGDMVVTTKGCRFSGPPGPLEVVEIGRSWLSHPAALCKKPNGDIRLFLIANLKLLEGGHA